MKDKKKASVCYIVSDGRLKKSHPLDIAVKIDFIADFASINHSEHDTGRVTILRNTDQGQISRSRSKFMVFLKLTAN